MGDSAHPWEHGRDGPSPRPPPPPQPNLLLNLKARERDFVRELAVYYGIDGTALEKSLYLTKSPDQRATRGVVGPQCPGGGGIPDYSCLPGAASGQPSLVPSRACALWPSPFGPPPRGVASAVPTPLLSAALQTAGYDPAAQVTQRLQRTPGCALVLDPLPPGRGRPPPLLARRGDGKEVGERWPCSSWYHSRQGVLLATDSRCDEGQAPSQGPPGGSAREAEVREHLRGYLGKYALRWHSPTTCVVLFHTNGLREDAHGPRRPGPARG